MTVESLERDGKAAEGAARAIAEAVEYARAKVSEAVGRAFVESDERELERVVCDIGRAFAYWQRVKKIAIRFAMYAAAPLRVAFDGYAVELESMPRCPGFVASGWKMEASPEGGSVFTFRDSVGQTIAIVVPPPQSSGLYASLKREFERAERGDR